MKGIKFLLDLVSSNQTKFMLFIFLGSYDWQGYFGKHMKSHGFRSLREYQKVELDISVI